MKKTAITLLLSFMFILFSGFNTEQEVIHETDRDSTTVHVKFENPRILIDETKRIYKLGQILCILTPR